MWTRIRLPLLQMCCESSQSSSNVCERGGHAPMSAMSHPLALDATKLSMRWIGLRRRCNVRTGPRCRSSSNLCRSRSPVTAISLVASSENTVQPSPTGRRGPSTTFFQLKLCQSLSSGFYGWFLFKNLSWRPYISQFYDFHETVPSGHTLFYNREATGNLQTVFPFVWFHFLIFIERTSLAQE